MRWILLFATTFAFVVLACEYGRAAEIMDRVVQCNRIAMGAGARVQGFQGHTEWVSKAQVEKYNKEDYKGSMYILDEGETPEQRALFDDPLMYGWKMENSHIEKHAGQMKDPREILEACMKQQDSSAGRLIQTQNESLGDPSVARNRECDFMSEVLVRAVPLKGKFDSADQMLEAAPFPEVWSDKLQAWAKQEITGLFSFIGNSAEYIKQRHFACEHAT